MAQNSSKVLQGIAIRLSWDLHSGAKENIISSLLSASINESELFREWFLNEIRYDGRHSRRQLYSEPNRDIVGITRAIKGTRQEYRNQRFPRYPDVVIYDNNDNEHWRKLEETNKNRRLSRHKKGELSDALDRIRVVFIEVKHTGLGKDAGKYNNLINGLSSYDKPGHLGNRHKFVIISSHSEKAKERIDAKIANGERTTSDEKEWHRFFGRENEGVMHVTLASIYASIQGKHRIWCHSCPVLQLFEYYLALHLGIFDNIGFHEEYWRQVIKGDDSPYGLKWSIADHISWLASNASVKLARGSRFDTHRTDELAEIEFRPYNGHGRLVKFTHKQQCEDLRIIMGKKVHHLRTGDLKKKEGIGELVKVLSAVSKYID